MAIYTFLFIYFIIWIKIYSFSQGLFNSLQCKSKQCSTPKTEVGKINQQSGTYTINIL